VSGELDPEAVAAAFAVDPQRLYSVTTILGLALAKHWRAVRRLKWAIEATYKDAPLINEENFEEWVALIVEQSGNIDRGAMDLGTAVHSAAELAMRGYDVPERWPIEVEPYMHHFTRWLEAYQPAILRTEQACFHFGLGYAGTLDLILALGTDLWLVDIKSGQSVDPYTGMQLAAYKRAPHYGPAVRVEDEKGRRYYERPEFAQTEPALETTRTAVLHLRPTGYTFREVASGEAEWQGFLAAQTLYLYELEHLTNALGPKIPVPEATTIEET